MGGGWGDNNRRERDGEGAGETTIGERGMERGMERGRGRQQYERGRRGLEKGVEERYCER